MITLDKERDDLYVEYLSVKGKTITNVDNTVYFKLLHISHWLTIPSSDELRRENLIQRRKEMNDMFWDNYFVPALKALPADDPRNYFNLMTTNLSRSKTYPGHKSYTIAKQIFSSVSSVDNIYIKSCSCYIYV
jgi:hypothetical protein